MIHYENKMSSHSFKVDDDSSFRHYSVLCMPIRNADSKIVGVSQLINKLNCAPFNKNDEYLFEVNMINICLFIFIEYECL